jgi:sterol desaturase/sphingolipid hydroxylase (fatty acid hydroxylase superfamily)
MQTWKNGLRVGSFPLLFAGVGVLAWLGYSPQAMLWLMPALVAAAGIVTVALERVIPYEPAWNRSDAVTTDAVYLALTTLVVRVAEAMVWSGLAMATVWLPHAVLWPSEWPMVLQVFLAFAVGDFLPYLYHRASHESSGCLWRIHAIHHAPERMYALNFARFHPVNAFLTASLTLLPLAALGASPTVLFVAGVLHNVHGLLSHANVDFRLGPLNAIFSMAELHRWHHARDPKLANGNYGATVLLWDWLFGTRRHPAARVGVNDIGLWIGSSVPARFFAQLAYPFHGPARNVFGSIRSASRGWFGRCCSPA